MYAPKCQMPIVHLNFESKWQLIKTTRYREFVFSWYMMVLTDELFLHYA